MTDPSALTSIRIKSITFFPSSNNSSFWISYFCQEQQPPPSDSGAKSKTHLCLCLRSVPHLTSCHILLLLPLQWHRNLFPSLCSCCTSLSLLLIGLFLEQVSFFGPLPILIHSMLSSREHKSIYFPLVHNHFLTNSRIRFGLLPWHLVSFSNLCSWCSFKYTQCSR